MKSTIVSVLSTLSWLLWASCSSGGGPAIAGTNVNTGNARVTASARYADGTVAARAAVRLRPADYRADTATTPPGAGPNPLIIDTVTDADGVVSIALADTGALVLELQDDKAYGCVRALSVSEPGQDIPLGTVTLEAPGHLSGTVRTPTGDPVAAFAQVVGLERVAAVDSLTGRFTFDDIPQGEFTIHIVPRQSTYSDARSAAVRVESGGSSEAGTVTVATFQGEDYSLWNHSQPLYLNTSATGAGVTETVTRFPVLIRLDASTFAFDQARARGEDLRFSSSAGRHLRYEIDHWDPSAASAAVWVLVDTILGMNQSQSITMHWGNPRAGSFSNGGTVFGPHNGYAGVWHMARRSTEAVYPDATGQGNDGVGHLDAAGTNAHIGGGQTFDGVDDYIDCGTAPALDVTGELTLSVWVKLDDASLDEYYRVISKKERWDAAGGYEFEINPLHQGRGYLTLIAADTTFARAFIVGGWDERWHYCVATARPTEAGVYLDGADTLRPSQRGIWEITTSNAPLRLGGNEGVDRMDKPYADYFAGTLDEVRISTVVRSPGWIRLSYENQRSGQTLVEFR